MIFTAHEIYVIVSCCTCGVQFGLPKSYQSKLAENGKNFYCPNGHSQRYIETRVIKLERELLRERQQLDQVKADRDSYIRRLTAAKGAVTKYRKRIGQGKCPCCKTSFSDLGKHMAENHPHYLDEKK